MRSTNERRCEILRILCERRRSTEAGLAELFGVSERTIRRDVEVLSISAPIYTLQGRYGGGIYVVDGYYPDRKYLGQNEEQVLLRVASSIEHGEFSRLSSFDAAELREILRRFSKPCAEKPQTDG